MQTEILIQGLCLGFAYAAPIGVQNMFVINTAINATPSRARTCGLIVALFDCLLALACFYGIGSFIEAIPAIKTALLWIGGGLLIYMGCKLILGKPEYGASRGQDESLTSMVWTAFVLTWFNPQALIDGSMILGAMFAGLNETSHFSFILGMCSASFFWFLGLGLTVSIFKGFISPRLFRYVNIICGFTIILFGLKLIIAA